MQISNKQSKTSFLFYLLIAYILLQFCWWAYLMADLNYEIYHLKTELLEFTMEESLRNETVEQLGNKLDKRLWMIAGEGSVFLILLLLGLNKILQVYKSEVLLANRQKNFLMSITHELKSPLASAKLQLETLMKHNLEETKRKEILSNACMDIDRLDVLVENILLAARIENSVYVLNTQEFNISALLTRLVSSRQNLFQQKIITTIEENIYADADEVAFSSIVFNLLENAAKYSLFESVIRIHLNTEGPLIVLRVMDEGTGIPQDEHKNIFSKFYRVGNEETRKTKGTGLGLYIVSYLVEKHGWQINVKQNQPKGSIFELLINNTVK